MNDNVYWQYLWKNNSNFYGLPRYIQEDVVNIVKNHETDYNKDLYLGDEMFQPLLESIQEQVIHEIKEIQPSKNDMDEIFETIKNLPITLDLENNVVAMLDEPFKASVNIKGQKYKVEIPAFEHVVKTDADFKKQNFNVKFSPL
ncbi:MAG: hypothetical protein LBH98_07340 [Chitinispirillales bacterium]|nr:hypothetical protein [Chitinispirillales bacterium]